MQWTDSETRIQDRCREAGMAAATTSRTNGMDAGHILEAMEDAISAEIYAYFNGFELCPNCGDEGNPDSLSHLCHHCSIGHRSIIVKFDSDGASRIDRAGIHRAVHDYFDG